MTGTTRDVGVGSVHRPPKRGRSLTQQVARFLRGPMSVWQSPIDSVRDFRKHRTWPNRAELDKMDAAAFDGLLASLGVDATVIDGPRPGADD